MDRLGVTDPGPAGLSRVTGSVAVAAVDVIPEEIDTRPPAAVGRVPDTIVAALACPATATAAFGVPPAGAVRVRVPEITVVVAAALALGAGPTRWDTTPGVDALDRAAAGVARRRAVAAQAGLAGIDAWFADLEEAQRVTATPTAAATRVITLGDTDLAGRGAEATATELALGVGLGFLAEEVEAEPILAVLGARALYDLRAGVRPIHADSVALDGALTAAGLARGRGATGGGIGVTDPRRSATAIGSGHAGAVAADRVGRTVDPVTGGATPTATVAASTASTASTTVAMVPPAAGGGAGGEQADPTQAEDGGQATEGRAAGAGLGQAGGQAIKLLVIHDVLLHRRRRGLHLPRCGAGIGHVPLTDPLLALCRIRPARTSVEIRIFRAGLAKNQASNGNQGVITW